MHTLQLNCDLGEGCGNDAALMPLIDQANIACGGHAGDAATMQACIALALDHGVQIGAHPAYPDRAGFGRSSLAMQPAHLAHSLRLQVQALATVAASLGARLAYIKPHGALYHDLWLKPSVCRVVMDLATSLQLPLMLQAGREGLPAESGSVRLLHEAFADRRYTASGALLGRDRADALLGPEAAAAQAKCLHKTGEIAAADGTRLRMLADSLCVHGDHPQAVAVARAVRNVLTPP